ncbi:MAG: hypothetical protein E6I49_12090 [Chloroflexi bacterium]|nr:MAG: hypothetical protein E6I49_12090 [Chloroflexota bacterium]
MTWRRERWSADHSLPIGVTKRAQVGELVRAGDIIAAGATLAGALRIPGARRLGLSPSDLNRELRARVGSDVVAGTVLARVGRRFARSVTAPIDGRLLHVTVDGDLYIAPIVDRWTVRATLDGVVSRSDDAIVEIEGDAWCFQGAAAYGPDAIGELTLGVDGPNADLAAARIDVRLGGRIIVGGARVSAEVITRAHACGAAGLVAGGVPPAGLRVVYGDAVTASGSPSRDDRPTVLCLMGFGSGALPQAVYEPFAALAGARAAIHTASARLFVFSTADIGQSETPSPEVGLSEDRPATDVPVESADAETDETDREHEEPAQTEEELTPSASDGSPRG